MERARGPCSAERAGRSGLQSEAGHARGAHLCRARAGAGRRPRPLGAQFLFRTSPRPTTKPVSGPSQVRGDSGRPGAGGGQRPTPSSRLRWTPRPMAGSPALRPGPHGPPTAWEPDLGRPRRRLVRGDGASGPPGAAQGGRPIARSRRPRPAGPAAGTIAGGALETPPERGRFGAGVPERRPKVTHPTAARDGKTWAQVPKLLAARQPGQHRERLPAGLGLGAGAEGSGVRAAAGARTHLASEVAAAVAAMVAAGALEPRAVLSAAAGRRASL